MSALATVEPAASDVAAQVMADEYARLLMIPRHKLVDADLAERARSARAWYAEHGRPWIGARRVDIARLEAASVTLATGHAFRSAALAERLRGAGAHAVVAVAVTAGAEAEAEYRRHWAEGRPDEGFFVERFAVGVTEQLVRFAAAWTCRESEAGGETALFHASPGCGSWPLEEQGELMSVLAGDETPAVGPVKMMPSGALTPVHSVLALVGLTRRPVAPTPADACRDCDLTPCGFRRAPYSGMRRAPLRATRHQAGHAGVNPAGPGDGDAPLRAPGRKTA